MRGIFFFSVYNFRLFVLKCRSNCWWLVVVVAGLEFLDRAHPMPK
jgi:hypothetical protein